MPGIKILFAFEFVHWYSRKVRNKNRTMNASGQRVRKYHFEHPKIDAELVVEMFKEEVFPHMLKHGYKLVILDNDPKFHTKKLTDAAQEEGLQVYPGSGKRCWVSCHCRLFSYFEDRINGPGKNVKGKYPPRSHESMPCETEFANSFQDAQLDVERREKNAGKPRTMMMWRNAIEHTWDTRPIKEIRKLIDRQPKIQKAIIAANGARVPF